MASPLDNLPLPQPGDASISARLIRTMVEEIMRANNFTGPGVANGSYGATFGNSTMMPDVVYARITAAASTPGFFEWEQVRPNLADGVWETPANGLTHDTFGELLVPGFGPDAFTPQGVVDRVYVVNDVLAEDGTTQRIGVPLAHTSWFYAKITSSSGSSTEHTVTELDANGDVLANGRVIEDAKAMNERKGVPVDTLVIVFDLGPTESGGEPKHKFIITDGLTDTPKDLRGTGAAADPTQWNVEEDSQPVVYTPSRFYAENQAAYFFSREVLTDASGMVFDVTGETEYNILASPVDGELTGHVSSNATSPTELQLYLNQPQEEATTFEIIAGDNISVSGDSVLSFDNSGRLRNTGVLEVTINATGGGGDADGQGYNKVTTGATSLTKANNGELEFVAATPGSGEVAVQFSQTNADPKAQISAVVDVSGLDVGGMGDGKVSVLDKEIEIANTAAEDFYTIDDDDYSGRYFHGYIRTLDNTTRATWEDDSAGGVPVNWHHASGETAWEPFLTLSNYNFFVDDDDGHKLKIELLNPPSSTNSHFIRVLILKGARKSSADQTIS